MYNYSGRTVKELIMSFQAARILAKLASWGKPRMALREQKYYMGWLIVSLNNVVGKTQAIYTATNCKNYMMMYYCGLYGSSTIAPVEICANQESLKRRKV